jgi:NADH-quinone oxidoreductase subunit J
MNGVLAAQPDLWHFLSSPVLWGLAVGALGLWVVFSNVSARTRLGGKVVAGVGLVILAIAMPKLSALATANQWGEQIVFWLFAGTALSCSAAAITSRNPVYSAIWFAGSLLGVAGLFLFQHAQFLGVATIVVYAGAIVVTFLFVFMLANPQGKDRYDRISWSRSSVPIALGGAMILVAIVLQTFSTPETSTTATSGGDLLAPDHVARLGTELFARHLVAVEVAATILLVALVGAVAMVLHDKERKASPARSSGDASRAGDIEP